VEYLFTYGTLRKCENNEFSNYLKTNAVFSSEGFMYGGLYEINGYPVAINNNSHKRILGTIYGLNKIDFNYLDEYEGENYIRKIIPIYTETIAIDCWVYLLRKI
jgi:gamma-glutamylcyclotransferase (GGCT)/AIG2-like uncharacterized protein YtfP